MGLVDLDFFAGFLFVVGDKGLVVVFVKLTRHVVGGIEQGLGVGQRTQAEQTGEKTDVDDFFHDVSQFKVAVDAAIDAQLVTGGVIPRGGVSRDCNKAHPSGHSPKPESTLI